MRKKIFSVHLERVESTTLPAINFKKILKFFNILSLVTLTIRKTTNFTAKNVSYTQGTKRFLFLLPSE